jgi:hypothetical protein
MLFVYVCKTPGLTTCYSDDLLRSHAAHINLAETVLALG